VTVLCK